MTTLNEIRARWGPDDMSHGREACRDIPVLLDALADAEQALKRLYILIPDDDELEGPILAYDRRWRLFSRMVARNEQSWRYLSDDELRARLEQRGIPPFRAALAVTRREDDFWERWIDEVLS